MPFISICIPAYKNTEFLRRLLNSIAIQTFKDFEVIITDDSPDESLTEVIKKYQPQFKLQYYKNATALGTPANWNLAISKASGEWIKVMHHDDWFAHEASLSLFAESAKSSDSKNILIFSGFNEIKNNHQKNSYIISAVEKKLLKKSPLNLLKKNFIGHPSTTLIKNNISQWYDNNIKWVVDIEFYIRYLKDSGFITINKALINIGISNEQVTKQAFRNPNIEIPENLYLLKKLGAGSLDNIFVYDYYWRLFRNLNITNFHQLQSYSGNIQIPSKIIKMLQIQFKIPPRVLKIGVLSKIFMITIKTFA
jgi:glycosyltransferase involved in cell wall biosynthesis